MLDSFYFHYKCKEVLQRFLNNSIKKKFLSVLSSFEMLWYLNSISLDNKKNILVIFLEELVCFSSIPSVSTRLGESQIFVLYFVCKIKSEPRNHFKNIFSVNQCWDKNVDTNQSLKLCSCKANERTSWSIYFLYIINSSDNNFVL